MIAAGGRDLIAHEAVDAVLAEITFEHPVDAQADMTAVCEAVRAQAPEHFAKYGLCIEAFCRRDEVVVQVLDGGHRLVTRRVPILTPATS